jgi:nucleoside-diphosphate-sugar epimerase
MSGRALVTGSAGFIGRHMVAHLLTTGWDVTGVDIAPGRFGWQANMGDYLRHETSRYDLWWQRPWLRCAPAPRTP